MLQGILSALRSPGSPQPFLERCTVFFVCSRQSPISEGSMCTALCVLLQAPQNRRHTTFIYTLFGYTQQFACCSKKINFGLMSASEAVGTAELHVYERSLYSV